jgi:competence protein ComEA
MAAEKVNRLWLLATGILILVIIAGSLLIWYRKGSSQLITINPAQTPGLQADIYVYGAVANPGTYSLKAGDSIENLIQASGGTNPNADLSHINLHVPEISTTTPGPQKIDINRADPWLLEALPDIGSSRARDIIEYRQQTGPFRSIEEIMNVPGISASIFSKIKDLITIED